MIYNNQLYLFNSIIKENICFSKNDEINENLLNKKIEISQLNDICFFEDLVFKNHEKIFKYHLNYQII